MEETIFEPYQSYQQQYKERFRQNASDYFDRLVTKAAIHVEENTENKKQYDQTTVKASHVQKKIDRVKFWRGFVVFLIILLLLFGGINIYLGVSGTGWKITTHYWIAGVAFVLAIACIVFITRFINKKLKKRQKIYQQFQSKIESLHQIGMQQMQALNTSFDWNMHIEMVHQTVPSIHLDPYLSEKTLLHLQHVYGYKAPSSQCEMATQLLTGSILNNPFLIRRAKTQTMGNKTYTGSLTISWTTTEYDSKGNLVTRHHTQTLHASLTKPAPFYNENTHLLYLNEAAPDLSFSREPSPLSHLDDKKRERKVRKKYQDLKEKAEDKFDVKKRKTLMTNDDFEVLFGATDRNHDIQFRLLFTPLAQQNELDLIQNAKPFGDDFSFIKKGKANYIISQHAQNFSFQISPSQFVSYSVELSKQAFISLHCQFFESLYFDLAPLLSIPLYQQQYGEKLVGENKEIANCEIETLLLSIPLANIAHGETITDVILKIQNKQPMSSAEKIDIVSYSYKGISHTDYISVWGGDGLTHSVPVTWIEYIPVERTTYAVVLPLQMSKQQLQAFFDSEEGRSILQQLSCYIVYKKSLLLLHFKEEQDFSTHSDLICLLTKRLQNV